MSTWSKCGAYLKNVAKNVIFSLPVAVVVLDSVGYVARVEGISMQPCLNPGDEKKNDFVLLNKWAVRNYEITHGDVVALICPKNPNQKLIKRVIAKEGDTIKTLKRGNYVAIPSGHCWVEGDHTAQSMDSNYFGPVAVGLIMAKASHIVWPPSRWRRLEPKLPDNRRPIPMTWPRMTPDLIHDIDEDDWT